MTGAMTQTMAFINDDLEFFTQENIASHVADVGIATSPAQLTWLYLCCSCHFIIPLWIHYFYGSLEI